MAVLASVLTVPGSMATKVNPSSGVTSEAQLNVTAAVAHRLTSAQLHC